MRHIKTFYSLTEAISLADARKATKIFLDSGGKERYNEIFKGRDRLYYYMDDKFNNSYIYNPLENQIKGVLETAGYTIVDYNKGIATKQGDEKNVFKIQKILNKIGESDLKNKMDADPIRFSSTKKDKMVVISRHGIDIAGQSTGRDWTSCKSITGGNGKYVWTEIEQGSLVAYLITPEDINIEKPIARILIGVYVRDDDKEDFILYPDASVYGNYPAGGDFTNFVKKWCIDTNKKLSPTNIDGEYKISDKCYVDSVRSIKIVSKPFDDIMGYLGNNRNVIVKKELDKDDMRNVFKSIESQESDLNPRIIFNFLGKIQDNVNPDNYAEFINGNSYNEIKKYLDKYPDFFVNYMTALNYNLISDKNKESKIRDEIKKHLEETEGPDYVEGFKALLDMSSNNINDPVNYIQWILK
jgi:hypothetical protein